METNNWITLCSIATVIIVAVAGWIVNSRYNNRNEIAKERRKYRIDTLLSLFNLLSELQEASATNNGHISHLNRQIRDTLTQFKIFGEEDEIKLRDNLIDTLNEKDLAKFYKSWDELTELACNNIRKELLLSKLPKDI